MQVFLSWSGDRSRNTAKVICSWLKQVIQALDPWMSTDIEKGRQWGFELSDKLEKSNAGIICLTGDNIDEKWILFEAGALSKMSKDAYVCTFLLDVNQEDIEPPLSNFQNTKFEKEDMRRLIHTLNSALPKVKERSLEEKILDESFETYWPSLEQKLKKIINEKPKKKEPERKPKEIMAEILEIVRSMQRKKQEEDWVTQLVAAKMDSNERRKGLTLGLARLLAGDDIVKDSSILNHDSIEVAKPRFLDDSIRNKINKID